MSQSLSNILIHLVFSTKNRERWLDKEIRTDLPAYLGGVLNGLRAIPVEINSVADHAHLLFVLPRTKHVSEVVEECKVVSSKWIKSRHQKYAGFGWQNGYGAFSVSPSHKSAVQRYIQGQEEHHERVSFQDELRRLFEKNEITYDERYVWD